MDNPAHAQFVILPIIWSLDYYFVTDLLFYYWQRRTFDEYFTVSGRPIAPLEFKR